MNSITEQHSQKRQRSNLHRFVAPGLWVASGTHDEEALELQCPSPGYLRDSTVDSLAFGGEGQ